jgi:hypothetical protein
MREEIAERYRVNLSRVSRLVDFYRDLSSGTRDSGETLDVLRAAVVFLHATLEDVLRTLLLGRWPAYGAPEQFEAIPVTLGRDVQLAKVSLADLVRQRGKTVDALIRESVTTYLDRASFNHLGEVKQAMVRSGLDPALVIPHAGTLAAMMTRRHQIVHRADREDVSVAGDHAAASLQIETVEAWFEAVEDLCRRIVAEL